MKLSAVLLGAIITAVAARNVQITSNGLVVATQVSGGLLMQRPNDSVAMELPLPQGINNFDDISIDELDNIFALNTNRRTACSYTLLGDSYQLRGCVAPGFQVEPFSGVSAREGVCVISGGTLGMTVLEYDAGILDATPRFLNRRLPNVVGFPDVQLVTGDLAAVSTDFDNSRPRFGTTMVDLDSGIAVNNFRVADSVGLSLFIGPSNFALVNAVYTESGNTYMYTANGGMTVQDPFTGGTTQTIAAPLGFPGNSFRAVTVSVDEENALLVVGGLENQSQSVILRYDITGDPMDPVLLSMSEVTGRITSIAANGGVVAYVGIGVNGITFVEQPPTFTVGCFSPTSIVTVEHVGPVTMANLQIGDRVLATNGFVDTVYSFGHYAPKATTKFLKIHLEESSGLKLSLEITGDHMLFLPNGAVVPAKKVKIGDSVLMSAEAHKDSAAIVLSVDTVSRLGAYAPFTSSGSIVVNGVVASNYIALDKDDLLGSSQLVAHLFQAPHRLVCKISPTFCKNETYNEKGLSWWVCGPLFVAQWFLSQWRVVQLGLFVLILPILVAIEVVAHFTSLVLICFLGYGLYQLESKKNKSAP